MRRGWPSSRRRPAGTDSRPGSRDAASYAPSPSSTSTGAVTVPEVAASAARPTHPARTTATGHRRPPKGSGTSRLRHTGAFRAADQEEPR